MRAVALVLALLALAGAPAVALAAPSEESIEVLLVCPTCHVTLDESNAPVAEQMKQIIRAKLAAGWGQKRILDYMVAQYGPGVLSTPARHGFDLLAWVLPVGGAAVGAVGLGVGAVLWSRRRGAEAPAVPGAPAPLDPELERRLDEELARFDG